VTIRQELSVLFDAWRTVHERYVRSVRDKPDCIWWSDERANIGALIGAAALVGWPAVQEFQDPRVKRQHRGDLWVQLPSQRGVFFEAKSCYVSASTPGNICRGMRAAHERSREQATKIANRMDRRDAVARITFASPRWRRKPGNKDVEKWLAQAVPWCRLITKAARGSSGDVEEWCGLPEGYETPREDGWHYPGVLLFGELLTRR